MDEDGGEDEDDSSPDGDTTDDSGHTNENHDGERRPSGDSFGATASLSHRV